MNNQLINKLSEIPNINKGGCGFFALFFAKKTGAKVHVFRNKYSKGAAHYVNELNGKLIDSTGIIDEQQTKINCSFAFPFGTPEMIEREEISIKQVEQDLKKSNWNQSFNRKDVKKIKSLINKYL